MNASLQKRGLLWWITSALAPIGVFGGPLALADLFSGLIRWNGWIGYLTHYWDEYVSGSVADVFAFLSGLVALPPPPTIFTDYLTLGVLFMASWVRAEGLINGPSAVFARGGGAYGCLSNLVIGVFVAGSVLLWPIVSAFFLFLFGWQVVIVLRQPDADLRRAGMQDWPKFAVFAAPFLIFLALCLLNALMLPSGPDAAP